MIRVVFGLLFYLCFSVAFADPAELILQDAINKSQRLTQPQPCTTNSCNKAMRDWLSDDDKRSWFVPGYKQMDSCKTFELPGAKSIAADRQAWANGAAKLFPNISSSVLASQVACSTNGVDQDQKVFYRSAYFLSRLDLVVPQNLKQIGALDSLLGETDGLQKVSCESQVYPNTAKQCTDLKKCASKPDEAFKNYVAEFKAAEGLNENLSARIKTLKKEVSKNLARDTKEELQGKIDFLEFTQTENLKSYPLISNPNYRAALEANATTEQALRFALSEERKQLVEKTNSHLQASLCVYQSANKGCEPKKLRQILSETPDLPDSVLYSSKKKTIEESLAVVRMSQQKCITDITFDRDETTSKMTGNAIHAGVDIGLTLLPGGIFIVMARAGKMATETAIATTRAAEVLRSGALAAKAQTYTARFADTVWFSQSSKDAVAACQAKEKILQAQKDETNSCPKVQTPYRKAYVEYQSCVMSAMLAVMDGLPLVGDVAKALNRATPAKTTLAEPAKAAAAKAYYNTANPQVDIWRLEKSGKTAEANAIKEALEANLRSQKVVSSESIRIGRSGAKFVKLEDGTEAVWKPYTHTENSGDAEIAASLIDKHLGSNLVPTVVEREIDGVKGALQVKINEAVSSKTGGSKKLAVFDYIIGNHDRHGEGNYLKMGDEHIAIDNGRAFVVERSDRYLSNDVSKELKRLESPDYRIEQQEKILKRFHDGTASEAFLANYKEAEELAKMDALKTEKAATRASVTKNISEMIPSPDFVKRLRATTPADWEKLVGKHLSPAELQALVQRQREMLNSLETAQKALGRSF